MIAKFKVLVGVFYRFYQYKGSENKTNNVSFIRKVMNILSSFQVNYF